MLNIKSQLVLYTKIPNNSDNIDIIKISNDNSNNGSGKNPKHKYIKVIVDDPFNNRDIILRVAKKQNSPLDPYWVTGFADGESCFGFRIRKNNKLKTGWEVIPYFFINLHIRDFALLSDIQQFFKVGNINRSGKNSASYKVNSVKELQDVIIPHFEQFSLISKKKADFLLFKLAIELIREKIPHEHWRNT